MICPRCQSTKVLTTHGTIRCTVCRRISPKPGWKLKTIKPSSIKAGDQLRLGG